MHVSSQFSPAEMLSGPDMLLITGGRFVADETTIVCSCLVSPLCVSVARTVITGLHAEAGACQLTEVPVGDESVPRLQCQLTVTESPSGSDTAQENVAFAPRYTESGQVTDSKTGFWFCFPHLTTSTAATVSIRAVMNTFFSI